MIASPTTSETVAMATPSAAVAITTPSAKVAMKTPSETIVNTTHLETGVVNIINQMVQLIKVMNLRKGVYITYLETIVQKIILIKIVKITPSATVAIKTH
jgi:hypothetical protein